MADDPPVTRVELRLDDDAWTTELCPEDLDVVAREQAEQRTEVEQRLVDEIIRRLEAEIIVAATGVTPEDLARRSFLISDPDKPMTFYLVTTKGLS